MVRALGRMLARGAAMIVRPLARLRRAPAWVHRPGGRFALHALATVAVLTAAILAGVYVVPTVAETAPGGRAGGNPSASVTTQDPRAPTQAPTNADTPSLPVLPGAPGSTATPQTGRPADVLAPWAGRLDHLGIPRVALQAYGYAELVVARTQPTCRLSWPTLAGIGKIESNHGQQTVGQLQPDGRANPPVIGPALDGQGGRKLIRDTDSGLLDGDRTYDRAVGPMQFIPSTWQNWASDGDGDGSTDPFDIDDAVLAAARYLCAGNRDVATPAGWWEAVLSYNNVYDYAQKVFTAADDYGQRSRSPR